MACDCISQMNEHLVEHNGVLVTTMFGQQKAVIDTVKIDTKKRRKPPVAIATFCPFCGTRYVAETEAVVG